MTSCLRGLHLHLEVRPNDFARPAAKLSHGLICYYKACIFIFLDFGVKRSSMQSIPRCNSEREGYASS